MKSNLIRLFFVAVLSLCVVMFFSMSMGKVSFAKNNSNDDDSNSNDDNTTWASGDDDSRSHDDGSSDDNSGHDKKKKPKKHWRTDGNANIDSSQNFLGTTDEADLVIKTDNDEKMRVTTDGDVGIGTDSPTGTLHVEGGSADGETDGKDITLDAQDGGPTGGAGGNIFLIPGASGGGFAPAGRVIVGTDESILTLDVNGIIRIRGGSPFIGAVLTALDSDGNAVWQEVDSFTNADEEDPVYSAWDKSTGISITESQVSDLNHFTNANETDPTVDASVKDGVSWIEVAGIPADIADGDDDTTLTEIQVDGFVANNNFSIGDHFTNADETDPTVAASVKDGVDWSEVTSIPADIADGDDVGITIETDPKVGANTTNYISKWDGSSLVKGTIFDNGNVGIGTTTLADKLTVAGNIVPSVTDTHSLGTPTNVWKDVYVGNNSLHIGGLRLSSDEDGGLSWDNRPLGTIWSKNGTLVYYNDGNIGIGTNNPEYKLDVAGTIRAQKIIGLTPDEPIQFTDGIKVGTGTITIEGAQPPNDDNRITFTNAPGIIQTDGNLLTITAGAAGDLILNPTSAGNVGIGTEIPDTKLHVDGEVKSVVNGVDFFMVPRGGIIMWSGPISDIPTPEWQLCDGNNGTPDLRNRFIVGAGNSYNVNDAGGSDSHGHSGTTGSHTLTVNEIPSHTHAQDPTTAIHKVTNGGMFGSTIGGRGGTTQATGGGQGHNHPILDTDSNTDSLPPFFALAYIMRL